MRLLLKTIILSCEISNTNIASKQQSSTEQALNAQPG